MLIYTFRTYERKHCYVGECMNVNIATLLCDCLHVPSTLLFQCWHSGTLLFSIECFSAGTQALWDFQLSVSVLALWHCNYSGFGGLNVSVLALWHSAVDMGVFEC